MRVETFTHFSALLHYNWPLYQKFSAHCFSVFIPEIFMCLFERFQLLTQNSKCNDTVVDMLSPTYTINTAHIVVLWLDKNNLLGNPV